MIKQRITVKLHSLDSVTTDNLILTRGEIQIPSSVYLKRQDKLTIPHSEIPEELKDQLQDIYQLHIQWNSVNSTDEADELFQNFGVKGLEINLVPSVLQFETVFNKFNNYFSQYLPFQFQAEGLISTATSATYHTITEDIKSSALEKLITQFIPSGFDGVDYVTNFDISWSAEDQELIFEWISSPHDIILAPSDIKKEIGLFQAQRYDVEDIELSGITVTLQDQDRFIEPSNTLLIVKPRHQNAQVSGKIDYQFEKPIGLHPTLQVSGLTNVSRPYENCELFLYSNLENSLIFDKFQYDEKTLQLINTWGDNDLELPKFRIKQYGSIQLFQVNQLQDFEIKYHSRYLEVSQDNTTKEQFQLLAPSFFWACDASLNYKEWELIGKNPFDSYGLGYESFFEESTNFYHLQNNQNVLSYGIPKAKAADFGNIQLITFGSLVVGVLYLLYKIMGSLTSPQTSTDKKNK